MVLKRNRYVWRLDLSLLGEENYNSEIGREVREHMGFYKACTWIGMLGLGVLFLVPIVFWIVYAELTYIIIFGIFLLLLGLMSGKLLIAPKLTREDIKKIEEELTEKSDRLDAFNAIFTENTLIVQQGIMIYTIPYLEINGIRVRRYSIRAGGNRVKYSLCDGTKVETVYYDNTKQSFSPLWEQLLKYNPDIMIKDS